MNKSEIIQHLCSGMDQGINPQFVSADTSAEELNIFDSDNIHFKVLSPMSNIDGYYMGGMGLDISIEDAELGLTFSGEKMSASESTQFSRFLADGYERLFTNKDQEKPAFPDNISSIDFLKLRSRMSSNALALAEMTGKIENNLSVVLLLEWHGKRLLFPGDAEWKASYKGAVKAGSCNGAWNVMWSEKSEELSVPMDFLKVGHHGSENATPYMPIQENKPEHPINQVLEAMLPIDRKGEAVTVVSTKRGNRYPSIPDGELLKELAKRVSNVRNDYIETSASPKAVDDNTPQPQRTDLELSDTGNPLPYIELTFDAP